LGPRDVASGNIVIKRRDTGTKEVQAILGDVTAKRGGGKFVMAHLADDPASDARIKEFKATVRNIPPVDEYDGPGKCIVTGAPVDRRAVVAKAY
jgi:prolyl-tRNA synthetase